MAVTTEKLEAALEIAIVSLSEVCRSGTNDEKISASKVLIEAVEMSSTQLRKEKWVASVLPLAEAVTKNLAGQLTADDNFAPVYTMDPAQQGSLLMAISKEIN